MRPAPRYFKVYYFIMSNFFSKKKPAGCFDPERRHR